MEQLVLVAWSEIEIARQQEKEKEMDTMHLAKFQLEMANNGFHIK